MGRRGTETAPTTDEMAKLAELEAGAARASQCGAEKEVTGREEEERCD